MSHFSFIVMSQSNNMTFFFFSIAFIPLCFIWKADLPYWVTAKLRILQITTEPSVTPIPNSMSMLNLFCCTDEHEYNEVIYNNFLTDISLWRIQDYSEYQIVMELFSRRIWVRHNKVQKCSHIVILHLVTWTCRVFVIFDACHSRNQIKDLVISWIYFLKAASSFVLGTSWHNFYSTDRCRYFSSQWLPETHTPLEWNHFCLVSRR